MPWTDAPGRGFTTPDATPWLAFGDPAINVAAQRADPGSTLHLVRDLIALRRGNLDLSSGAYATLPAPGGAWAFRRGDGFVVALNLSDDAVEVASPDGRIAIATDRAREGEAVAGAVALAPWEAVVVALA